MKRKIIVVFSLLLLFLSVAQFSQAAVQSQPPGSLQEAISLANQELGWEYFTQMNKADKPIRFDNISNLGYILVYGDPHGDTKGTQSRYLGYTWNDEDYTNPAFPHDAWGGGVLEDRNWIKEPWNSVQGAISNGFDGDSKYLPNIQEGLKQYYADVLQGESSPYWNNWYEYVHILQPPTYWTWGMGRMWQIKDDGSTWYITVPLAPTMLKANPQLIVVPASATVNVGGTQQYTATYYPQGQQAGGGQDVSNSSIWTVADSSIASIGSNTGLATGNAQGTTQVTAAYNNGTTTLQGTAQLTVQTAPQPQLGQFYTIDGCFLTMPQKEGDVYTTWVIRAPRDYSSDHFQLYSLDKPVTTRITVYQFGPTNYDNLPGTTIDGTKKPPDSVPQELVYDEEVTFTKDNPAWAKKFSFPAPSKGVGYGLVIMDGITGVSCSAYNGDELFTASQLSSHRIYDGYYSTLPWDYITATYGISPNYTPPY